MKTSVTMKRKMGIFDVFQRTSDGMFNKISKKSHKSLACG